MTAKQQAISGSAVCKRNVFPVVVTACLLLCATVIVNTLSSIREQALSLQYVNCPGERELRAQVLASVSSLQSHDVHDLLELFEKRPHAICPECPRPVCPHCETMSPQNCPGCPPLVCPEGPLLQCPECSCKPCNCVPCDSFVDAHEPAARIGAGDDARACECPQVDLRLAVTPAGDIDPMLTGHWRAQAGQDKYVYETFFRSRSELKGRGVFVEFGAQNGIDNSNTYFFEKALGWRGVLVEFIEREHAQLAQNRPNSVCVYGAVGARDGHTTMMVSDYPGLSGDGATIHAHRRPYLGKQARVPVHRLEGILDRAGITHVNYMTVDTEGSEATILAGFDFGKYLVDVVQVEHLHFPDSAAQDAAKRHALEAMMRDKGYALHTALKVSDDTDDLVFVRAPRPVDANAFDAARKYYAK